nr:MAG TPA: recombination protein [Caudoviricetes sp.]
MTNEIAQYSEIEQAAIEQLGLREVPRNHVELFFATARAMQLDPRMKRDIALISRNSRDGKTYTIQVGIAGYRKAGRKIANANGEKISKDPWLFMDQDGNWRETWAFQTMGFPVAAKSTIYRDGEPWTEIAMWDEFNQGQALWKSKPSYMLGKTAESLAWRSAFPEEMGDTYEESEVADIQRASARRTDRPASSGGAAGVKAALEAKKEPQVDVLSEILADIAQITEQPALEGVMKRANSELSGDELQTAKDAANARYFDLMEAADSE